MASPEHRLDLQRPERLGMVEAVWGEHKTAGQIVAIAQAFAAADRLTLVTRVDPAKAAEVQARLPAVVIHDQARCLTLGSLPPPSEGPPPVALLSGGSSDRTVVAEAELALACHGIRCERLLDVGVAGLHRLLEVLPGLRQRRVLIACAGMEGALPTVVAGLSKLTGQANQ
jgi:NCAIR mutase (PurE)-related protein